MADTADELEIRNLTARLAHLADDGDLNEYIALFTEDGVWEVERDGKTDAKRGHAEIMAGARARRSAGTQGPGTNTRHVITTQAVTVKGDTAEGRAYIMMMKDTKTAPTAMVMVVYSDSYRKTPQGWRLTKRSIKPA